MGSAMYVLDGVRYLTSGEVAEMLKIDQRTVLRWVARASRGRCPELLKRLVWTRDPSNGFTYFQEASVLSIRTELMRHRPQRLRT